MRVTDSSMYSFMRRSMQDAQRAVQDAQVAIASGRKLQSPSDDPAGVARSQRLQADQTDRDVYNKASGDAQAWLGVQDAALQSGNNLLRRARELVLSANNSSRSQTELNAIAGELEHVRGQLVSVANTRYDGRAVFGGFQANAVGGSPGAWTFSGDDGAVNRRIDPDTIVQVNTDGAEAFGFNAGQDVFSLLDDIVGDLRAGDLGRIDTHIGSIDGRSDGMLQALGTIGAKVRLVENVEQQSLAIMDEINATRAKLEHVDLGEAALELSRAETGYEATLAVAARVNTLSLLDFLR